MKTIRILSKGEIADSNIANLNENILVISFFNTDDIDIIRTQKLSLLTNESILNYSNNIISIRKDDIQILKSYQKIVHKYFPYENIFSVNDLKSVISFLEDNNYKEKDIIFQCEYGKSRSLSLAIALNKYFFLNTHEIKHDDKRIRNFVIYDIVSNFFNHKKKP